MLNLVNVYTSVSGKGFKLLISCFRGKRGFGSKRIVMFSDLAGAFGDDQLDDILGSFKEQNIEFNLM